MRIGIPGYSLQGQDEEDGHELGEEGDFPRPQPNPERKKRLIGICREWGNPACWGPPKKQKPQNMKLL